MVSVVLPSRGRVPKLHRMLKSLYATAGEQVEVVVRADYDDAGTIEYLRHGYSPDDGIEDRLPELPLVIVGPRLNGYPSLPVFINQAARLSVGDVVLVVNDDAIFRTSGWDVILEAEGAKWPDGIYDIGVDTANADNFVFPCTSRRIVDILGVHDERVLYNDVWLRDVMSPFGRAVRIHTVVIEHDWQGPCESQRRAMGQTPQVPYHVCVEEGREVVRWALGLPAAGEN